MQPRSILTTLLVTASMATPLFGAVAAPPCRRPPAKLPIWRGFSLLESFRWTGRKGRFGRTSSYPRTGRNFVRLPMDYRLWIVDGDWRAMDEAVIRRLTRRWPGAGNMGSM